MIIIAVPATVRSLEQRGGAIAVITPAEEEELLEPPQLLLGKGGHLKREAGEVGTHPQVGGGVHGPIETATGVTPPLPRRSRRQVPQRLPGVTIGNSNKPQPVQVEQSADLQYCEIYTVRYKKNMTNKLCDSCQL